jgi:hypothetical protein
VLKDESLDHAVPLAGINYTHLDLMGKNRLLNVFFAGAFANVSLSDPALGGTKLDFGASLTGFAFAGNDKVFRDGEELVTQRVQRRTQSLTLSLGYPLTRYLKLRTAYGIDWIDYGRAEETRSFRPPSDNLTQSGLLELAFDWRGWSLRGQGMVAERSRWESWGVEGALETGRDLEEARDYQKWLIKASKSFYLPYFQKIELSAERNGGHHLDRFSQYQLGFLAGQRVRGFGGSGIRYQKGTILKAQYSFSIVEAVRFDLNLDHAIVDALPPETGRSDHTGIGVAANFLGPWKTVFRLDAGYALRSDLEVAEGDWEFLLAVLRLF